MNEAEYSQRLEKNGGGLVRVGLSQERRPEVSDKGKSSQDLEIKRTDIRQEMILTWGVPADWMEPVNPVIKRDHLGAVIGKILKGEQVAPVNIIRGPPDSFYIVLQGEDNRVQVLKVYAHYQALSDEMEGNFAAASGSRP